MTQQDVFIEVNKISLTKVQKLAQVFYSAPQRELERHLWVFLSGHSQRKIRQEIMSELKGKKVPIAKSGVTAIQEAIMQTELWQLGDALRTIGMEDCQDYAVEFDVDDWKVMRFHWMHEEKGFYPHFVKCAIEIHFMLNKGKLTFKDSNNVIHNL